MVMEEGDRDEDGDGELLGVEMKRRIRGFSIQN